MKKFSGKTFNKFVAAILCFAMMFNTAAVRAAGDGLFPAADEGEVVFFAPLDGNAAHRSVPAGTQTRELDLPQTLEAMVSIAVTGPAPGTPSDLPVTQRIITAAHIPVTWEPWPQFDGEVPGAYVFTAALAEDFALAHGVYPPYITVTVERTEAETPMIIAFAPLADDVLKQVAAFGTELEELDLPQTLTAAASNGEIEIPVTWQSEPEYDGFAGEFIFTAALGGGFVLADGVYPPQITVEVEPLGVMPHETPLEELAAHIRAWNTRVGGNITHITVNTSTNTVMVFRGDATRPNETLGLDIPPGLRV